MAVFQLTSTVLHELFLVSFVGFLLVYAWFKYKFTYWARRGVVGPEPSFPFGNLSAVVKRQKQFFQPYYDTYFQYKKFPYVGLYSCNVPILCINDLDVAKHILVKDFDNFLSHGMSKPTVGDPLGGHLFNLSGPEWKTLRAKLSPMFSLGKLKSFFPLVNNVASDALEFSDKAYAVGKPINFSEFYAKYSMEIIGSVGFGIENDGFKKETEFYKRGHEYFTPSSAYWTIVRVLSFFAPGLFEVLKINRTKPEINKFFYDLVIDTYGFREKNNFKRNDFLQSLIELHKSENEEPAVKSSSNFTFTDVAANTMLYMFAGFETSATTGMFAAYELARHPEIQTKVRLEMKAAMAKHNGEFTYETQNDMPYMNMVLEEAMRKYPPMRALFRRCNKDYKVPGTDLVIEEGTLIFIPIHAIQMDPDVYEDPEKFDPERFTPANKAKMHQCQWMPFGEGPRKCLGVRQGYLQSKMGLLKLLEKYELSLDDRTKHPITLKPDALAHAIAGDLWIKLKPLENP